MPICLPVFENIYILIIVLLCLFIYVFILYFLKFILSMFLKDHIGNKCAIVCFSVSILGQHYIYMYYNVYQIDSLTRGCDCVGDRLGQAKRTSLLI